MFTHIVLWRLKDRANGLSKTENMALIKEKLELLRGRIDGLLKIEVGFDVLHTDMSADIALYAVFASREAHDHYQNHPLHRAIMPLIMEARIERRVIDYETED